MPGAVYHLMLQHMSQPLVWVLQPTSAAAGMHLPRTPFVHTVVSRASRASVLSRTGGSCCDLLAVLSQHIGLAGMAFFGYKADQRPKSAECK